MNNESQEAAKEASENASITIKKYANRRLYNTATSCYVTLDYLAGLVKAGTEFAVYDAKTGEDITRSVLTHIIVEEEAKGQSMLPVSFLRHLISFYGDSLQIVVPQYLEHTMQMFACNQEQMRDCLRGAFEGLSPFASFEEMSKQQLAIFERAIRMFSPFHENGRAENGPERHDDVREPGAVAQIDELREQLNAMRKQLDQLTANHREK